MTHFQNSRKDKFISSIPIVSLENESNDLTNRSKFNFSYFDESQNAGQKFEDWDHKQLVKLLNKLREYSRNSLQYWSNQKIGSGEHRWNVFEVYGSFPKKSKFLFPKHVPHQAMWARFRLENSVRLVGFIVPEEYHKKEHSKTKEYFDKNTFYVVFFDQYHSFYLKR